MPSQPPRPGRPLTDFGLLPGERPAVPQAQVDDTEDAWDEFKRFSQEWTQSAAPAATPAATAAPAPAPTAQPGPAGSAFAPTEPAPLLRSPPAPPPISAASRAKLEQALAEARRFNRVCPQPVHWQRLYDMLPNKVTTGRHPHPPPPIGGSAWQATPALPKRLCLRDHLEWADSQGVLDEVMVFLKSLREDDWHHMGD
jgi:hypothetical protein